MHFSANANSKYGASVRVTTRGVHRNGSTHGNRISVGFPREWEVDLNKDGNGNKTTWEWERLMLVGSQKHSRGLVKFTLHYTLIIIIIIRRLIRRRNMSIKSLQVLFVCGFHTKTIV